MSGSYQGEFDGVAAQLTLADIGATVSGELRLANGYVIRLSGERRDDKVSGAAASGAGAATFDVRRDGDALTLTLEETAPLTGRTIRVPIAFYAATGTSTGAAADNERDQRLNGTWLGSALQPAGDMILRVSIRLELHGDGSYRQGDDAGSTTMTEAEETGLWRVSQGKLQLQPAGATDWKVLGFYQLRGNELILIDGNGHAQNWQRQ